ncbi:MAG: hypothetical protein K1X94_35310 [Sandaracinaceae bacterium]|nr:hypothetical protein [Sandaracinaceae bacterium]
MTRSAVRARALTLLATLLAVLGALVPDRALATPGPDSVAILANSAVPGSVALAEAYADARDVPHRQICAVPMPTTEDVSLADFQSMVRGPLESCLTDAGVLARIEAIVIARGVPLRVSMDIGGTSRRVSLAAALALWNTTMADGTPVLGQDPGHLVDCGGGSTCWGALWRSGYRGGPFEAGWERTVSSVTHRPMLVTMLHGRSDADAMRLVTSSVASEGSGMGEGEIVLMDGADPARGALDGEYATVLTRLDTLGVTAREVPFAAEQTGLVLAGFATGTASLGQTIEGNTFVPGALVDNLTSFGAVPENFRESGESQVSIARWVAMGVAGAHGTTDEPLNNCFPSRTFLSDYASGATLAESYFARMPYIYWHNLVLGDPMAAPYAHRPEVALTLEGTSITTPTVSAPIALGTALEVSLDAPADRVLSRVAIYVDGVLHEERLDAAANERAFTHCLGEGHPEAVGDDVQVLVAVTMASDIERDLRAVRGWRAFRAAIVAGDGRCAAVTDDAGASDAGASPRDASPAADAGPSAPASGCACRAGHARTSAPPWLALTLVLGLGLRRRRRA